jgi:DNA invertase Pin-like site-specific DNA recombinase
VALEGNRHADEASQEVTAKIGVYARVSTGEQSTQQQLDRLRREAPGAAEYVDQAVSGSLGSRPAFDKLRGDAVAGKLSAVYVVKLDRLGRSAANILEFFREMDDAGVRVVVLDQHIDTSTPVGRLVRTVLAAMAELEADLIRERTRDAMAEIKAGRRRTRSGLPPGRPRKVTPEVEARIRSLRWPETGDGLPWKTIAQYVHLPAGTCSKVPRAPTGRTPLSEKGAGGFGEPDGLRTDAEPQPHKGEGVP